MKQILKTRDKISAALMLFLFLFPIFTQVTHAFSDHDHPVCKEVTTHIHKLDKDCSISDFHYTTYIYTLTEINVLAKPVYFKHVNTAYKSSLYSKSCVSKGQRGPPSLS